MKKSARVFGRIGLMFALASAIPPGIALLCWEEWRRLPNLSILLLTPLLGLFAKILIGTSLAAERDWRIVAYAMLIGAACLLELVALAHVSGVRIPL